MNKKYLKILAFIIITGIIGSCSKKEELIVPEGLGGDTWEQSPLDVWLEQNFVEPYNIEVKYRFDRYELALNKTLTPVMESKIMPVMETIKQTWITPYETEAGSDFIKSLAPKQFVLVGSPEFNENGTITLGTAEGGRKVVLFKLNDFDKKDKPEVKQMLHTIHHEFAHILHQTVMYPEEYKRITTDYTASWNDFSLEDARSRGYITEYARSSPNEDFVEMISLMLIEGKAGFDTIINNAPADAQPLLRRKEQVVVRYFLDTWKVDIYQLQAKTEEAIQNL